MVKADLSAIRHHLSAAGIQDHPAILAWELAWEPIYYRGTAGHEMDFLSDPWNRWIVQRYGSIADAKRDWQFDLKRMAASGNDAAGNRPVGLPEHDWLVQHGSWDRIVAAFRRFFSDYVGGAYGEVIRGLRRYDSKHLITFRFGACGIPHGDWFAHSHSASVAKQVDFLCPEGYNLQPGGFARPTPLDEIRKGGLVTLYSRWATRGKPLGFPPAPPPTTEAAPYAWAMGCIPRVKMGQSRLPAAPNTWEMRKSLIFP